MHWPWRPSILVAVVTAVLLTSGSTDGAEPGAEPGAAGGHRTEVVISGVPYVIDVVEPFPGTLLVSAGAESPGGRLVRFALPENAATPLAARSGEALLSSRWRLGPIVSYHLTGRIYVGVAERGQILQLPQVTRDLSVLARWEPELFIVGLTAVHDFTFGADSRLLVADGSRILETPIYFTPPMAATRLRTVHQCAGTCLGVAVARSGALHVREADGQAGRVVRRDSSGTVHVVASGLPPGRGSAHGPPMTTCSSPPRPGSSRSPRSAGWSALSRVSRALLGSIWTATVTRSSPTLLAD